MAARRGRTEHTTRLPPEEEDKKNPLNHISEEPPGRDTTAAISLCSPPHLSPASRCGGAAPGEAAPWRRGAGQCGKEREIWRMVRNRKCPVCARSAAPFPAPPGDGRALGVPSPSSPVRVARY